jgi:hypothetical protein
MVERLHISNLEANLDFYERCIMGKNHTTIFLIDLKGCNPTHLQSSIM